jgi:hypothetical protein
VRTVTASRKCKHNDKFMFSLSLSVYYLLSLNLICSALLLSFSVNHITVFGVVVPRYG